MNTEDILGPKANKDCTKDWPKPATSEVSPQLPCSAPETIFLQWWGDQEPEIDAGEPSEVTWCQDKIWRHDVPYVRADILQDSHRVHAMILRGTIKLTSEQAQHIAGDSLQNVEVSNADNK